MSHKRAKTRGYQLLINALNLLLYIGIALALIISIKHIFFDKSEMAHASQQNFQISDITSKEDYPSPDNDAESDIRNVDNIDDKNNSNNIAGVDAGINNVIQNASNNNSMDQNHNADATEDIENKHEDLDEDKNVNINASKDESNRSIDGEINLQNSVFIGDSITEALSYYKFVSHSRVIANKGYTAKKALSDIDKIVKLKPDRIFILLGLNDILTERKVDRYINNYSRLIQELKKNLPNADIYIQSILPVNPGTATSKLSLSNSQIDEFNEGLKTLVQQENVHYLDLASIAKNCDENLHEPDGIHYKSKFCSLWLEYIKKNIQN